MLDRIISYSFYILFFLTPLFWTSLNHELFEYNKMILTYGLTTIIVGIWILKMIQQKSFKFSRTPLDIPLLLFLGANILSTIFSIDTHTSIWGYYSRSNGGLLSLISYLLLYWAFVSNFEATKIKNLFYVSFTSGFIISLYGILEHFGVSPSCIILRGEFNASCWVQDVQARVFATLGQPNWMAAYLSLLIFPVLYFFLTATTKFSQYTYYILLTTYYLAFTFTYSRGPTLGLIGGMVVFLSFLFFESAKGGREVTLKTINISKEISHYVRKIKPILFVVVSFAVINILFGSALTNFRLVSKFAAPSRPGISLPGGGTQLENGGTESGQIRFIVWKGALDIFKHYPLFGSGVETFAYSYYQFRPASHNLTSEWDFLYNKAHNEYLNYLATTGILGFGTYMLVIGAFVFWSIKYVVIARNGVIEQSLSLTRSPRSLSLARDDCLLILTILASYISYLIYNFFLFSVVIIAIFFYLFPAIAFVATESVKAFKFPSTFHPLTSIFQFIYRRPLYTKAAKVIVIISTLYLLFSIFQLWLADTYFAKGEKASEDGSPGRAYNLLITASTLNSNEPFYQSELSFAAASSAVALEIEDATLSAQLKDESQTQLDSVLSKNPNNTSFWRSAIRTYFELSSLDKKYVDKTLDALDKAINLAPTDPKLYYNKGLVLLSEEKKDEALKFFKMALELKPNYVEVQKQLEEATRSGKQ